MFCPQLAASISTAKLGHREAARVLCHLATFLNKPPSPTSISQEDSGYQHDTWSLRTEGSGKHGCRLALLPNPSLCTHQGLAHRRALGSTNSGSLVKGTSPTCVVTPPTCKMGWSQPVFQTHLPETLLFYSSSRNAKMFAKDMANIPLVQLNTLNSVSLEEKADPESKLITVYQAPKQQRLPTSSPAQEGCRSLHRDRFLSIDTGQHRGLHCTISLCETESEATAATDSY